MHARNIQYRSWGSPVGTWVWVQPASHPNSIRLSPCCFSALSCQLKTNNNNKNMVLCTLCVSADNFMNEGTNEGTNKLTNGWRNERRNQPTNERTNQSINKWLNKSIHPSIHQWINQLINQWLTHSLTHSTNQPNHSENKDFLVFTFQFYSPFSLLFLWTVMSTNNNNIVCIFILLMCKCW